MILPEPLELIEPEWPCPLSVRACLSTRRGGTSQGPYASGNLGDHVGDDPVAVASNRELLAELTGVRHWPWLKQVHGVDVLRIERPLISTGYCADAVYTSQPGFACAVLTADCLPLLLTNTAGTEVSAAHAGWRGLAAGVIQRAVAAFCSDPSDLLAYLGPAIGPQHFEVGAEVFDAFRSSFARMGAGGSWRECLVPSPREGHFYADLYGLARAQLQFLGVHQIYGGDICTFSDAQHFYSYRRDGVTGRMVSAIWMQP